MPHTCLKWVDKSVKKIQNFKKMIVDLHKTNKINSTLYTQAGQNFVFTYMYYTQYWYNKFT